MVRAFLAALVLAMPLLGMAAELGIHEGKIVSAGDGKLAIVDEDDGESEEFLVTAETAITLDGAAAELDDLVAGQFVKVTSKQRKGRTVAAAIAARTVE